MVIKRACLGVSMHAKQFGTSAKSDVCQYPRHLKFECAVAKVKVTVIIFRKKHYHPSSSSTLILFNVTQMLSMTFGEV